MSIRRGDKAVLKYQREMLRAYIEDNHETILHYAEIIRTTREDLRGRLSQSRFQQLECAITTSTRKAILLNLRETRKTLQLRIREHEGAVRKRETTALILMHTAETGHNFDFEGENVVKETLHLDHKQLIGASHKEGRQFQVGYRPGVRTDTPVDEAPTQRPSLTVPTMRASIPLGSPSSWRT